MLTQDRLVELYRDLKDRKVLTIYVDGEGHDPANRRAWRTRVEHQLSEVRRSLGSEGEGGDASDVESAARHLLGALDQYQAFLPDRGWVGFATPDRSWHAETVPVPMPDLVAWEQGIRAAPYVRALKQARPVVVVLADRRRGRIFTYRDGQLAETDDVLADRDLGDLSDTNLSKRGTVYSGSRGKTAEDEAQRLVEVNAERLVKLAVERVADRAGRDGLVVVGGVPETAGQVLKHLLNGLRERVAEVQGLHVEMSDAEVKRKAEEAATELTRALQEGVAEGIVNLARSGGRGVLGDHHTAKALLERRVETLVLTRNFIRANPDRADHLLGTAFEQGAEVEELSGPGADTLDREGDGVGARLRW
jgi:hypothetical protein